MDRPIKNFRNQRTMLFFSLYVFLTNFTRVFAYKNLICIDYILLGINILLFLFFIGIENNKQTKLEIREKNIIEKIFWLMIIFIDLSKILHGRFNLILFPFLIFGKIIPSQTKHYNYKNITYINLIGLTPFLLFTIYANIKHSTFNNNGLGNLLTIQNYFILILLNDNLKLRNKSKNFLLSAYLIVSLLLTYSTGSRTAFLTSVLLVGYFLYHRMKKSLFAWEKLIKFIPIFLLFIIINRGLIEKMYAAIFLKWGATSFDFTFSGRTGIWYYTLKNFRFLGGGDLFFLDNLKVINGHNILINTLGFYGIIPTIAMVLIMIFLFYTFIKEDCLNIRLFIMLFFLYGTFEGPIAGANNSYFQSLFFLHFSLLMNYLKNSKEYIAIRKVVK